VGILKFFRGHLLALACVAVLLVVQAYCDLSLPQYMSDIVNVGVGQGGIVSAVPSKIGAQDLSDLEMFMDDTDRGLVESCYSEANGSGVRSFVGNPSLMDADSKLFGRPRRTRGRGPLPRQWHRRVIGARTLPEAGHHP